MTTKKSVFLIIAAITIVLIAYFAVSQRAEQSALGEPQELDPTPQNVTLSGTFECLQHKDTSGPQTMECGFGFLTDDGVRYAVNFGQSAEAAAQFQSGAHVTADGFTVIKEALSTNEWDKYDMVGIFTITQIHKDTPGAGAKININAVCEGALAYMTFPDGASADAFVAECKEGKHPEVLEQYKSQMNIGDGKAI